MTPEDYETYDAETARRVYDRERKELESVPLGDYTQDNRTVRSIREESARQ